MKKELLVDNINTLKDRVEKTGGYKKSIEINYFFKHLILELSEYEKYKDSLLELAKTIGVDFISVKKNGFINYIHLTDISYKENIEKSGLIPPNSGFIGDLGYGIYVVDQRNYIAIDNLKDYIIDEPEDTLLLVYGSYCGEYIECIYGIGHKGYINIPMPKIDISHTKEIDIEEFLLDY